MTAKRQSVTIGRRRPKTPRRTLDAAGAAADARGRAARRSRSAGEGSGFASAPGVRNARTSDAAWRPAASSGSSARRARNASDADRPREEREDGRPARRRAPRGRRSRRSEAACASAAAQARAAGAGGVRLAVEGREEALLERAAGGGGHRAPPVAAPGARAERRVEGPAVVPGADARAHDARELDPRAVQARLHGAVGELEEVADLAVVEAVEVAEDHDLGELVGELGDRVEEEADALAAHGVGLRVVRRGQERRDRVVRDEREALLAAPPPVVVDAEIAREGRDPREERRLGRLVAVEVLPDLQEALLGQLLGLRAVVGHVPGDAVDLLAVGGDEVRPGAVVAALAARHELGVGVRGCRHRSSPAETKTGSGRFRPRRVYNSPGFHRSGGSMRAGVGSKWLMGLMFFAATAAGQTAVPPAATPAPSRRRPRLAHARAQPADVRTPAVPAWKPFQELAFLTGSWAGGASLGARFGGRVARFGPELGGAFFVLHGSTFLAADEGGREETLEEEGWFAYDREKRKYVATWFFSNGVAGAFDVELLPDGVRLLSRELVNYESGTRGAAALPEAPRRATSR